MADVGRTAYLMHNTEWQATVLTAFWVIDEHLDFNAVGKMVVIGTVPACIYISVPTAIATTLVLLPFKTDSTDSNTSDQHS